MSGDLAWTAGRRWLVDTLSPIKNQQCQERERLLREWTQCGRRLTKLLDEQLATIKSSVSNLDGFEDQIWLARSAETEARSQYFSHVDTPNFLIN
jgi:hypothetical protein